MNKPPEGIAEIPELDEEDEDILNMLDEEFYGAGHAPASGHDLHASNDANAPGDAQTPTERA